MRGPLCVLFTLLSVSRAGAEIHDYMILRLLYLNSSCGTLTVERVASEAPLKRYKATCKNVSAYPDGLTVLCTDPDDDRHCRIETPEKTFQHLDLLRK